MAIFGSSSKEAVWTGPPVDPKWARTAAGRFHRFVLLDPEAQGLTGQSGVFVIWHGGLKPEWVYVGKSKDLAAALHEAAANEEIMYYDIRGGLFVTWSHIKDSYQDGVVRFLTETLKPVVDNPRASGIRAPSVPVFPPAYQPS